MTRLRQIMLEELRRRNYAESTIDAYIHTVEHFSQHFHRSPDHLARSTFASIRPRCLPVGIWPRTPSRSGWQPYGSSMSRC